MSSLFCFPSAISYAAMATTADITNSSRMFWVQKQFYYIHLINGYDYSGDYPQTRDLF
jgi:hypothetical protein